MTDPGRCDHANSHTSSPSSRLWGWALRRKIAAWRCFAPSHRHRKPSTSCSFKLIAIQSLTSSVCKAPMPSTSAQDFLVKFSSAGRTFYLKQPWHLLNPHRLSSHVHGPTTSRSQPHRSSLSSPHRCQPMLVLPPLLPTLLLPLPSTLPLTTVTLQLRSQRAEHD